jgi:hypothetical protein
MRASSDQTTFAALWTDLDRFVADLDLHLALSNRASIEALVARKTPVFVDESATLHEQVANLGGLKEVIADRNKLQKVSCCGRVLLSIIAEDSRPCRRRKTGCLAFPVPQLVSGL